MAALILLLNILVIAEISLIPHHDVFHNGIQIIVVSTFTWVFTSVLGYRMLHKINPDYRKYAVYNNVFLQVAALPLIIGGVCLTIGNPTGIHWLVFGIIACLIKAVVDAWVLLIEIHK